MMSSDAPGPIRYVKADNEVQSPTYEDMLLLSSILGPAKPPVASREEVASAPGVYRIAATADSWVAASSNTGDEPLVIEAGERCLICLCEYAVDEEVRQLSRCRHVYHRECIDEVGLCLSLSHCLQLLSLSTA